MVNDPVKFKVGTSAQFDAATKDQNSLYFITDTLRIYKGDVPYSGISFYEKDHGQSLPAQGMPNTIYMDEGTLKYWDVANARYETLMESTDSEISGLDARIAKLETDIVNKADEATTLAGYGITDAYTKTETATEIANAVASAGHLKREIVQSLPPVAEANEETIYMVLATPSTGSANLYDEFMLINGAFEKIGDTRVDLTNYPTRTEVAADIATAKSEAITQAGTDADTKIAALVQNTLPDYVKKTEVTTGQTSGTIAVAGTDVAVKGLGTAAYANTTDFDAAGAAATAEQNAKDYADSILVWTSLA